MKFLCALALAALVAGCGDGRDNDGEEGCGPEGHAGAHAAKNGGVLRELGDHEGFVELKVDHGKGVVTLWVYEGEEMSEATLAEAPVLNLKTNKGPQQLTGDGMGGVWVFKDDILKGEFESARLRMSMNGKSYTPEWTHGHEHDHDHDEHEGHDHDGEDHEEHEGHDHDGE